MRRLLLLALLATGCDQGARASPPAPRAEADQSVQAPPPPPTYEPYVVHDKADFVAKAKRVIVDLIAIFEDGTTDCGVLASRLDDFTASNHTRFHVLTEYGKAHREAEQALQEAFKPELDRFARVMQTPQVACMSDPRVTSALTRLSETNQR